MRLTALWVLPWVAAGFAEDLQIRGDVADVTGAAVPGTTVRLLAADSRETLQRRTTDDRGAFDFGSVPERRYLLAASAPGFREKLIPVGPARPEGGRIQIGLDFAGCDAPGVICDSVFNGPYREPNPVVARGELRVRRADGIDLDTGELRQSGQTADIELRIRDGEGLYLAPINGARMGQPGAGGWDCADGKYDLPEMRIDGLGRGSDLCVLTNGGRLARVFLTGEVAAASGEVKLYFVIRKR